MTREDLVYNAFLDDLRDDWIAVAANGHPIARASDEASVRRAAPDAAHYFNAGMLADRLKEPGDVGGTEAIPNPVAAGLDAVKAQGALAPPETDAKADKDLDDRVRTGKSAGTLKAKAK